MKYGALVFFLFVVGLLASCNGDSPSGGANDTGGQVAADAGPRDTGVEDSGAAGPDAGPADAGVDAGAADGGDGRDGSYVPYGWVNPRCVDSLVRSCADCPGRPYVCHACELSANCVSDCNAECGGRVSCPGTGECVEPGVQCTTEIFCGCAPPLKDCKQGEKVSCVDNCTAECPGLPNNFYGSCSDIPEEMGGCPDGEGPEYYCDGYNPYGICTASCEACGPAYCLSLSCSGDVCNSGYLADYPFYYCGKDSCCEEGFLCPATSACVPDCSECAGATAGACGKNGRCVANCSECSWAGQNAEFQVCGGECVDVHSDLKNCSACGQVCTLYSCVDGHCCANGSNGPPGSWCDVCNCCFRDGISSSYCVPSECEYYCVK